VPERPPSLGRRKCGNVHVGSFRHPRLRGRAGVRLRQQVRDEEPLCRRCLAEGRTRATAEVDHIRPLSRGGSNDRSNLQGLCAPCHLAKSIAEGEA
jgi:5-methylcytosine-specific restriction enzyme A